MISSEFENLIVKFLSYSATQQELETLEKWIRLPENEAVFKQYVKSDYALTLGVNDPDSGAIRGRLLKKIKREGKKDNKNSGFSFFLRYAAIVVIVLGLCYFSWKEYSGFSKATAVIPKQQAVTLELDNGDLIPIPQSGSAKIINTKGKVIGRQQGEQLSYDKLTSEKKLYYNTLIVPFGRRFNLVLSDGTKVFLNAGSSIRYPTEFLPGKKRQVLLTGEAYFDVISNESPFEVSVDQITIKVYGTQFNVSDYKEDKNTEIVLVEGSVELTTDNKKPGKNRDVQTVLLEPGFKGNFNKTDHSISTEKVDTSLFTAWLDGVMVFKDTSFESILKKLERQYNVTIVNNNTALAGEHFNATIATKNETIEQVLGYFNTLHEIDFNIIDNKIVIN